MLSIYRSHLTQSGKWSHPWTYKKKNLYSYHHHFSFSGSVSPKSCVPCMLVCPLRPPLLTSDWLGCCCCCSDLIGFDSRPPDTGSRPVAVIVVLVDKLDMGCWEETSGGLLMCVVGGGGAGPCPPWWGFSGPWPPWWGRPMLKNISIYLEFVLYHWVLQSRELCQYKLK